MNIFIDTNLLHQAIRSPSPDPTTLKALLSFLKKVDPKKSKRILLTTDQVKDEYYRSEEKNIHLTREKIIDSKSETADVRTLLLKKSADKISDAQKELIKHSAKVENSFDKEKEKQLENFNKNIVLVKDTITELFSTSKQLKCDEDVFKNAEMRSKRGMHPKGNKTAGKENDLEEVTIGDAVNWELLLKEKPEELIFISKDGDFLDEKGVLHKTLEEEWTTKVPGGTIKVFRSIYEFLDSEKAIKKPKKSKKKKIKATIVTGGSEMTGNPSDGQAVAPSVAGGDIGTTFIGSLNTSASVPITFSNSSTLSSNFTPFRSYYSHPEVAFCPYCGHKDPLGPQPQEDGMIFIGSRNCSNCGHPINVY